MYMLFGLLAGLAIYGLTTRDEPNKLASFLFGERVNSVSPSNSLVAANRRQIDSYHAGIARVAPSVVSLYSSETIYSSTPASSVVGISPLERLSTSQGSGVIIDASGLVLTNFHLIAGADTINVVLSNGELHEAKLLGRDKETDLAVVKIQSDKPLPHATFESSPQLRVGDIVLAIGNPFGVGQTVTQGIVSATARRVAGGSAWQNFVQIDAAINPGNSGGALINPSGQLVGINTAAFIRDQGAQGIGFAISADLLKQVVPQLVQEGRVIRGWLGIGADELPMFPALNQRVMRGAVITGVLPDSPAERAGLRPFDVVTKVGDRPINNATDLLLLVSAMSPDHSVQMSLWRSGEALEVTATLGERPRGDLPQPDNP